MLKPLSSYLVGKPAVQAALEARNRNVYRLLLSETLPQKRAAPFLERAEKRKIPLERVATADLVERTGIQNHGGVAAEVSARRLSPFQNWYDEVSRLEQPALLFAFENFHEPHNLGYALRCVEALGADALLMDRRDWGEEDVIIAQSSSGAFDRLRIAALDEARDQFKRLEEIGIESLLATPGAHRDFYDFNLRAPVLIAVGGEFKGLSDEVRKACRHSAHLPMADAIPSFPAGHAAALLASEVARQRRIPGPAGPLWTKPSSAEESSPSSGVPRSPGRESRRQAAKPSRRPPSRR